jgi:hypothetical protein
VTKRQLLERLLKIDKAINTKLNTLNEIFGDTEFLYEELDDLFDLIYEVSEINEPYRPDCFTDCIIDYEDGVLTLEEATNKILGWSEDGE